MGNRLEEQQAGSLEVPRVLEDLSGQGIYNIDGLRKLAATSRGSFLVEGLINEKSVNVLAGNSGLGKTPLMMALGIAVASGTQFLGLATKHGRVLYCDLESSPGSVATMLEQLSKAAGLASVPRNFEVWSPHWDRSIGADYAESLVRRVESAAPVLVIVDPLRNFFPEMEQYADKAGERWNELRRVGELLGVAFILVHHLRKMAADAERLIDDPDRWLQNAAGSLAVINGSDLRMGVERQGSDELVLAGLLRGKGRIDPIHVTREYDEDGEVLGYRRMVGLDNLTDAQRTALNSLPERFRFADAENVLGTKGGSSVAAFLKTAANSGVVTKLPGNQGYKKTAHVGGVNGALALAA